MSRFVHLHVHSQYSILDSTVAIPQLIAGCKELGFEAVALTDFGNLFAAVDFYKEAKAHKVQPIIGIEIMLAPSSRHDKKKQYGIPIGYPITLIAKDLDGYHNLSKLASLAYIEGFYYVPRIDKELLRLYSKGLICLSGSHEGLIARLAGEDQVEQAKEEIKFFKQIFQEDFYLELQRHRMSDEALEASGIKREGWLYQEYLQLIAKQEKVIQRLTALSRELGVERVVANDVHYLRQAEWKAHEILMNVQSGETCEIYEMDSYGVRKGKVLNPKREAMRSTEYFFKSADEMLALFSDDLEACAQTVKIAEKCRVEMDFSNRYYPVFVPAALQGASYTDSERQLMAEQFLRALCHDNIQHRYDARRLEKVAENYPGQDPLAVVKQRLGYELEIIISKGMCDYILIVYDFINWAKGRRIPVGPGRGSGAGSIVLYLIGVTDIEPLRFHLFFERFINPERISYPDIDVDICMDRRQEVIDYTIRKYGHDKVAQIITFGTMKAKMAIKDVGRVLNVPIAKVNEIAKAVPDDLAMTLEKALAIDPDFKDFYENDEEAKAIIDFAIQVEGSVRNTGIHAAGIIISGEPLMEKIPVCTSKDSPMLVTQYSMKPVEAVGMLKIDFLGLKTLTSIQKTVDAVNRRLEAPLDWVNLELDNTTAFELLNQGKTSGVFQLESSGMQELAKQLHIDKFEEIIAVGALYRPGPMEMIPSFINRKHGREEIENDHPLMKDILKETYGIIVYQEQVMQIAQVLAGYSLGEGDMLRRAMGKKDKAEMARQGEKFRKGAQAFGIDESKAMAIFEKVEKFASYGFNKSHAAAYGYLSYVTAYLKANYPKEWMAALMTCDMVDIQKVAKHVRECEALGIQMLSPDVNESEGEFVATNSGIRFALSAIKGIGTQVVEAILEERRRQGEFSSLNEFIRRIDAKKVGKKGIQGLIDAGCFDFTQQTRAGLHLLLESSYDAIAKQQKERLQGIFDLFEAETRLIVQESVADVPEIPKLERLKKEKELLGFYLTGHPLQEFSEVVKTYRYGKIDSGHDEKLEAVKCICILETVEVKLSGKTNKKFAVAHVCDGEERYELLLWSDLLSQYHALMVENKLLGAVFMVDRREGQFKLQCRHLIDLMTADQAEHETLEEEYQRALNLAKMEQGKSRPRRAADKARAAEEKPLEKVVLEFKADQMRLSHILEIKNLLNRYPGKQPVKMIFHSSLHQQVNIERDPKRGITLDPQLIAAIEMLDYFHHLSTSA